VNHGASPRAGDDRRALTFIVLLVLIDTMSFGLVIPVLPALVMDIAGVPLSQASAIGGGLVISFALAQFAASPVLGGISDRYGRRPVLLLSMAGHAIAFTIAGLAGSLAVLLAGRIIAGITGASFSTAYAYIADVTPPERRAQNFGLVGVAFGFGFMTGPALGGLLGGIDPRLPFFAASLACVANLLLGCFVLPESLPRDRRRAFDWKRANPLGTLLQLRNLGGPVAILAAVHFLWWFAIQAQHTIWPYYTQYRFGWSPQEVGLSLGLVGGLAVLVNGLLVKRAVRRLGEVRTLATGLVAGAIAMLAYAMAPSALPFLLAIGIGSFGGLAQPALQALVTSEAPANAQGELQGGLNALSSLTTILGPLVYSQTFYRFSGADAVFELPGAPFLISASLALFAFGIVLTRVRQVPCRAAEPATDTSQIMG
jgi:DHA1 family tetracycline resistance protein-like MFS transporter